MKNEDLDRSAVNARMTKDFKLPNKKCSVCLGKGVASPVFRCHIACKDCYAKEEPKIVKVTKIIKDRREDVN